MRHSLSFLGTSREQLPSLGTYGNEAVEAVLFNRLDLENDAWNRNWINIAYATTLYGPQNVTFHFPMNGCDYVSEAFARERLQEGYARASQLGLAGYVVHSNRIFDVDEWKRLEENGEREHILSILSDLKDEDISSKTWIGIENMPAVGNYEYETDPLFTCTQDFATCPDNVNVVWDYCHSLSSIAYMRRLNKGRLPKDLFCRVIDEKEFDPSPIEARVAHWHFAASYGFNDPRSGDTCKEGVLPVESDIETTSYHDALAKIAMADGDRIINYEVQEENYTNRIRGPEIIRWAKKTIATKQGAKS